MQRVEGKGKNKKITVVEAAGTFFTEHETDEKEEVTAEDGTVSQKPIWKKTELGESIEVVILYQRRQLRMYDEKTELYTSSPVFDTDDDVIKLFCNKNEVGKGTPAELKSKYMYQDKDGKQKCKLEENRILYVLYEGEKYQLNLRGSSMYAYLTYARKTIPNTVVTRLSSEAKEKGDIAWNQMTFVAASGLETDPELADQVLTEMKKLEAGIQIERQSFAALDNKNKKADAEMDELVEAGQKKAATNALAAPKPKKF